MAVLVTGGAGYLGATVVRELLKRGMEVVSIDNLYRGDYRHLSPHKDSRHLKMAVGDISSIEELKNCLDAVKDLSSVVHLAAISGLARCDADHERAVLTNILGTLNVLEVAREHACPRVIFASSASVLGVVRVTPTPEDHPLNPINLYGVTKLAGEKIVEWYNRSYDLSTVIFRIGNMYGVGLFTHWEAVIPKFVKQALEGKPLTIYGSGNQARDFIHVLDVSNAVMLALNNKKVSGTFNLGSSRTTSVNTIADSISEVFRHHYGKKVKTVHLPPREGESYKEDFRHSIDKIRSELGFHPQRSLREGIEQTVEYAMSRQGR